MTQVEDIKVIKAENFKLENVVFSQPKPNSKGGNKIYVNYDYEDGKPAKALRIQMPKMKAPFGVSGFDATRTDKKDTSPNASSNDTLDFSLDNKELLDKLEQLEKLVLKQGSLNSKELFKKKFKENEIEMFYKSFLKFNETDGVRDDTKYAPRLKTKLYKNDQYKYNISVYNSNRKKTEIDIYNVDKVIPRGCECVTILTCPGIWQVQKGFGLNFVPSQVIVYKSDLSLPEFAFLEDKDIKEPTKEEEEDSENDEYNSNNAEEGSEQEVTDLLDEVVLE